MDLPEANYRELFDLAAVMILSIDPVSEKITACNQQVVRSLGYDQQELLGREVADFCVGESARLIKQNFRELMEGQGFIEHDLRVQCKDQTIVDVRQRASAVRNARGDLTYVNCTWLNISQRKQAERELNESRHQFQSILDHASAIICIKDLAGRYLLINRRFEELFNLTLARVQGETDFELFPEQIARNFRENDRQVVEQNCPITFEETVLHGDEVRTYISLKFPLMNELGRPYAIAGIATDITLRKQVEAALSESEERFRQLAENIPDCFWVTEVDSFKSLYVSIAYERIWGRPRAQLYENPNLWFEAIHEADRARVQREFLQSTKGGTYDVEYRVVRPDGRVCWVHDHGVPILDQDQQVFRVVGIAQDITERKMLEKQVADVGAREQQRIGHEIHDELGQQLTGLSFLAKSLERRLADQELPEVADAGAIAEGIQSSIREVRRLVRGFAPVDLDEHGLMVALEQLTEQTFHRSGIVCRFTAAFEVRIPDNSIATQLYRIAQEAVNNAVKHSGAGRIDVSLIGHEGMILLRVHDTGSGISHDTRRQTSMGLAIMRYRANVIGADLEVKSSSRFGTEIACVVRLTPDEGSAKSGN
ncbi:MAG: PAS domain S-box protein [Pirellulaceae bacterium]|nr:PAS domain S-box protein [Pirellulaceae bacterium]